MLAESQRKRQREKHRFPRSWNLGQANVCLETRTVKISKPMRRVPTAQSQNSDDTVPFLDPADPNSHQEDRGRKTRLSQTKRSRTLHLARYSACAPWTSSISRNL